VSPFRNGQKAIIEHRGIDLVRVDLCDQMIRSFVSSSVVKVAAKLPEFAVLSIFITCHLSKERKKKRIMFRSFLFLALLGSCMSFKFARGSGATINVRGEVTALQVRSPLTIELLEFDDLSGHFHAPSH
jgi:hypothetical protein